MSTVIRLTNGLRKLKMADYNVDGSIGAIYVVADLTAITAETAEGEVSLSAGNGIIYNKKTIGKTTGSCSFYGMTDEAEAKLFDVKDGKMGGKVYGLKANRGYKVLIIEGTAVNPTTNIEEDTYMIFPKVSLGLVSDEGASKDQDGNETISTKSLAFTALALDNAFKTYKYVNVGTTPATITLDMFDLAVATTSVLSDGVLGEAVLGE